MMLAVLAVLGLMVLVVTVSPPDPGVQPGSTPGAATPTSTPAAPISDPDAFDVSAKVSAEPGSKPRTIRATLGDRVEIVVEGSEPDSVALGDIHLEPLADGVPARFQLLAETPGTYPLVLVNEDRRIGALKIS
jgi:hypothetical protein